MRRLKIGDKVLGGIKPPEPPKSEYKEDVSIDYLETTIKKLESLLREDVQNIRLVSSSNNGTSSPLSQAFLGVSSLREVEFPRLQNIGVSESAYNEARESGVVHLEQGQTIRGELTFKVNPFSNITSITPGTDIRATNTIGPNFSRRQQKDIEE